MRGLHGDIIGQVSRAVSVAIETPRLESVRGLEHNTLSEEDKEHMDSTRSSKKWIRAA